MKSVSVIRKSVKEKQERRSHCNDGSCIVLGCSFAEGLGREKKKLVAGWRTSTQMPRSGDAATPGCRGCSRAPRTYAPLRQLRGA